MAGHSKFKNIMYRKGAQDKKRANLFAKLGRELTTASREGGPDPDANSRLRTAIATARGENMPKDNIERAIKKGSSKAEGDFYDEIRYEGYGTGGVALIVETLTNNRNRTSSDLRAAFTKNGGGLAETGSVSFLFDHVGEIIYPAEGLSEESFMEGAIDNGAEDIEKQDDFYAVFCASDNLHAIANALEEAFGEAKSARLVWRPKNIIPVDFDQATGLIKLMETLDDHDDVQHIYANYDISDEVINQLVS